MPNQKEKYTLYFQALIDELREQHNFTDARRPGQGKPYYAFASGATDIKYVAGFYGRGRQAFTVLGIYSNNRKKKQSRF